MNGQASGPVLQSGFLVILAHSGSLARLRPAKEDIRRASLASIFNNSILGAIHDKVGRVVSGWAWDGRGVGVGWAWDVVTLVWRRIYVARVWHGMIWRR